MFSKDFSHIPEKLRLYFKLTKNYFRRPRRAGEKKTAMGIVFSTWTIKGGSSGGKYCAPAGLEGAANSGGRDCLSGLFSWNPPVWDGAIRSPPRSSEIQRRPSPG